MKTCRQQRQRRNNNNAQQAYQHQRYRRDRGSAWRSKQAAIALAYGSGAASASVMAAYHQQTVWRTIAKKWRRQTSSIAPRSLFISEKRKIISNSVIYVAKKQHMGTAWHVGNGLQWQPNGIQHVNKRALYVSNGAMAKAGNSICERHQPA